MWQFPTVELGVAESESAAAERAASHLAGVAATAQQNLGSFRHSVTRFRITLSAELCAAKSSSLAVGAGAAAAAWKRPAELATLAMPAAHKKLAARCNALAARR
jgi:A/G-specific adenine glycosylase